MVADTTIRVFLVDDHEIVRRGVGALLDEEDGIEVVFWGADKGTIELHDAIRDVSMTQHFARSMSVADAMSPANFLAYEMNGVPLPEVHGFPLRLIAPGWYGIANVKWLTRIEVRDRRLMNQFMARDYVTIREEEHNGETYWAETSVGRMNPSTGPGLGARRRWSACCSAWRHRQSRWPLNRGGAGRQTGSAGA